MTRLPTPGSDTGKWGEILNEFLSQAHTADGQLKTDSVTAAQLAPGSVVTPAIADGSITQSKLHSAVQSSLGKADTAVQPVEGRILAANLPALFRSTDTQPFTADSIWNTPMGDEATYETHTDTATADLLDNTPVINDTLNGYGFYLNVARPTDPVGTGSYVGESGTVSFTHRIPYDSVISTGSDASMRVIDGRWAYDYWKTVKVDDFTYTADFITRTDLLGTGRNTGTRAARFPTSGGLIRSHELAKGYIPHALCISTPATSMKRGYVWPAAAEDAETVTYSGEVPMGSLFAIPPSVDIDALSLSQEGYALAEAIQDYGLYVGDSSGSAAISVDGEAAVVMRPALERMRTDWPTIFALLRRVTNVGTTAGGPGTRLVPSAGPITVRADYQETIIDVLMSRARMSSGTLLTSENCATDANPIVATNAGYGGRSFAWTGYPAQYRVSSGAIRRIAAPDGSTRVLFVNPGQRNARLECTIGAMHTSGWAYLVARAVDSSNSYRIAFTSGGALSIQKTVGGTVTTLAGTTTAGGTVAVGRRVGIAVYGPHIYALVNGEVVAEAVDASNQTGTQCGIYLPSDTTIALIELTVRTIPRLVRMPRVES